IDVLEELVDRRVVAVEERLDERPRPPRRGTHREPRERGRRDVPVALRAHAPLADRGGAHAPGRRRIGIRAEDRDLVRLEPAVPERGVADQRGEPVADDRGGHYLTEPASRPCTKERWEAKKTPSGMISDRNEAGAIRSMFVPNWR